LFGFVTSAFLVEARQLPSDRAVATRQSKKAAEDTRYGQDAFYAHALSWIFF